MDATLFALIPGIPGGVEIAVLAAVGLLLFGKKLPGLGRSLGHGIIEFKRGVRGVEDEWSKIDEEQINDGLSQGEEPEHKSKPT